MLVNGTRSLTQIFHEANPRAFVRIGQFPDSCARRVINSHKHVCIAYVRRRGTVCHERCTPWQLMWIGDVHSVAGVMIRDR